MKYLFMALSMFAGFILATGFQVILADKITPTMLGIVFMVNGICLVFIIGVLAGIYRRLCD